MKVQTQKITRITRSVLVTAFLAALITISPGRGLTEKRAPVGPSIIPKPLRMEAGAGAFRLSQETKIIIDSESLEAREIGEYLALKLRRSIGYPLETSLAAGKIPSGSILLQTASSRLKMGNEGYRLTSSKRGVKIESVAPAGLFYGVQTLLQLLPAEVEGGTQTAESDWSIPFVRIEDEPRFIWRGAHLDVGRHFFPKEFIKRYIDLLAMYKMNMFHWHLTEDQGWRIEIKKYPRLTEIGAWRRETMDDLTPHGGFYTQEDIREVVAYAKTRFITVVPEIELPGNSPVRAVRSRWVQSGALSTMSIAPATNGHSSSSKMS